MNRRKKTAPRALLGIRVSMSGGVTALDIWQRLCAALELSRPSEVRRALLARLGITDPSDLAAHRIPLDFETTGEWIDGVRFRVLRGQRRSIGRKPHRLEVECPACGQWVGIGRFHQHVETHFERND